MSQRRRRWPGRQAARTTIQERLDAQQRDWGKYARQAAEFHLRNARAWASAATGEDLTAQIDPGFTLTPDALGQLAAVLRDAAACPNSRMQVPPEIRSLDARFTAGT
jgi:hypothetical protein